MIASIRSEKTEHVVMNIQKILNNPKRSKKKKGTEKGKRRF